MTLLEQCQIWNENDEYQKIIDAIEAVPEAERTPELCSELARAYNNSADVGDRALFEKAIALLKPYESYFEGDHCWNFRMGYAYYYLDQEGTALHYFQKALEARPGDRDTQELIASCLNCLALPQFEKPFRVRTQEAWAAFLAEEGELRRMLDRQDGGEALVERCSALLKPALSDVAFELGYQGGNYELVLTPEGDKAKLFELVYFWRHAPAALQEHWSIQVGRPKLDGFSLHSFESEVDGEEVQVWVQQREDDTVSLTLYCEKLLPLLEKDEDRVWWMLSTLTDQILGEISAMALIHSFEVVKTPPGGPALRLKDLPQALEEMGLSLRTDAAAYLEHSYQTYEMEPVEDPEADWRLDVYAGSTRLPAILQQYLRGEAQIMDAYHRDGIVAGFFCYPLDGFDGPEQGQAVMDFRDALESAIMDSAGADAVTFLGGASGIHCGYLDFIAWDLHAVLRAAAEFFEESSLAWASFHSFRRDVSTVRLWNGEEEPPIHAETESLLAPEDIAAMEDMVEGPRGYYPRMFEYIQRFVEAGVEEGRFTRRQARRDLQIALWYAYACINMDEYEFYHRAAQWMPTSEKNAKGCGVWYYRYSVSLMYCGRLEEARRYAELGAQEEPDYPWIWLQVGKLRSHFGDREGALEAVERGLALEPGDYEFETLRGEILSGATLEQMEFHWIDPELGQNLQEGGDADAEAKRQVISCLTLDPAGLERFMALFQPNPASYEKDDPYCSFSYLVQGRKVRLVFQMNEAALSKLDIDWLTTQKARLDDGRWLRQSTEEGEQGILDTVLVGLDRQIKLVCRLSGEPTRFFQVWLDEDGLPVQTTEPVELQRDGEEAPECYTPEEMEVVEQHIQSHFGPFQNVWHELVSPDIHVDICILPPSDERNYYTLVTMGMGAHRMNVPPELAGRQLERAELAIALPPDWKLGEEDLQNEEWYWPVRLLKVLARLPGQCDTWLGWGHTVDNQTPFAENTDLCAALLVGVQGAEEGAESCTLPGGDEVNFYQVIPLYREEMEYKQANSADELLERISDVGFVVRPDRDHPLEEEDWDGMILDDSRWHVESIREKKLPVEEITVLNHMAIYLRWCMEHDLMSVEFLEQHWDTAQRFQSDFSQLDLRVFIRDELDGRLCDDLFDEEGVAFARAYYGEEEQYPKDVDQHALEYFGEERYRSDEFQNEAYLFVPFDEAYYEAMAAVIQARFDDWQSRQD